MNRVVEVQRCRKRLFPASSGTLGADSCGRRGTGPQILGRLKHFLNREMLAPNVMTVSVDADIVAEFAHLPAGEASGLVSVSPPWNSDVRWISPATEESFSVFESAFERLDVARHAGPYLDVERKVQLYTGFLVVRSRCTAPDFHVDWNGANNEAFTLLTPVAANCEGFGLLYERLDGAVGEYDYKVGEAILLGDNFRHSTKPGCSPEPVVLLCFEFGTDRMDHWDKIYRTIGYQAAFLCRPDGKFVRADGKPG
jgi:hypothetical protein